MPSIKYLSHACFLITDGPHSVLLDPFLTGNPNAPCTADEINPSVIVVSHGHGDHLGDSVEIAKRTGCLVVAVFELAVYCQQQGAQAHPMAIGGQRSFDWGSVKFVPAFHSSSVQMPDGFLYVGMPAGMVLTVGGKTIYFAGDTGLFGDMALIGRRHQPDVAILPIGDNFTMGIDDAVEATLMIQPKAVIPMHYDTFDVIQADIEEFKTRLADQAVECHILDYGGSIEI